MPRLERLLPLLCLSALPSVGQTTVFGTGGLNYVPGAHTASREGFALSLASGVTEDPLRMTSVTSSWLDGRLEVSLSNTAWLVHDDSTGWKPLQTLAVPVIPSAKVILDGDSSGRQAWGLAAGLGLPWGLWGAAEWRLHLPLVSPTVVAGLGTPVRTVYAFGGLRLDLCDLEGRALPVSLVADGAMAGSTSVLGRSEEAFGSVGVDTRIGGNLTVSVTHRRDVRYRVADSRQNTRGTSLLQLTWNFAGVKAPVSREAR